jgi:dTDP-4-amino-4,6-dideoxygalactose transaminase
LILAASGFSQGDEVITTTMTFPATANAIIHKGLCPVFVDVELGTMNMNVAHEDKITRAIIPVHFAGHPCDMGSIIS